VPVSASFSVRGHTATTHPLPGPNPNVCRLRRRADHAAPTRQVPSDRNGPPAPAVHLRLRTRDCSGPRLIAGRHGAAERHQSGSGQLGHRPGQAVLRSAPDVQPLHVDVLEPDDVAVLEPDDVDVLPVHDVVVNTAPPS